MKVKWTVLIVGWIAISSCDFHQDLHFSEGGTVVSMDHVNRNDSTWTENYIYNENNNLSRVNGLNRNRRYTIIEYNENNQIDQILQYSKDGDELLFRDSLIYDDSNLPVKNYHYSINNDMELTRIDSVIYNEQNNISAIKFNHMQDDRVRIEKYKWENENIVNMKKFDEEENLLYEYNYRYDDMRNYKKELPYNFQDYLRRSENNVTWYEYVYHSGPVFALLCNPCINEYRYNKAGFPVTAETSYGLETKIEYR